MFNIDIASLRDPATMTSIKNQLIVAAAKVQAFENGTVDAEAGVPFQASLNDLCMSVGAEVYLSPALHSDLAQAYNLGWDTVRLQRGVVKNAK